MSGYGVQSAGFVGKSATQVKSELEAGYKQILGASAGSEPDGSIPPQTKVGQQIALEVDGISALWDLAQAIYDSFDPTQATDDALDATCAISGTVRNPAVRSTVTGTCTGAPGTVLATARVASVVGTGVRFDTTAPATIAGPLASWTTNHGYLVGDRVTNAGGVYQCITTGTSANAGPGPTSTTSHDITDNTCHWSYLGPGTGAVDVSFQAEQSGPFAALSYTLSIISTPVSGWQGVTNVAAASVGAYLETNPALRVRRELELAQEGDATADAIRARILAVGQGTSKPVTACTVFQNQNLVPDGAGRPGKSVEVLVQRATSDPDPEIAAAVFGSVAAGIQTYGGVSATVVDSAGNNQTVRYSRPTAVPIWITISVTYDPNVYPASDVPGGALIAAALVTFGSAYPAGKSVRSSALEASAFDGATSTDPGAQPVPGVLDVTSVLIGTAPGPVSSATIAIGQTQIATFDVARVVIVLTPGAP